MSEWKFIQDFFLWKCEEVLGHPVGLAAIRVLQVEIGNNMLRRRLDSLTKCVTLTDANGVLERIYQKDDSTIRREVKVKNTTIEELEARATVEIAVHGRGSQAETAILFYR